MKVGTVYLVGAGPGDPQLLTVGGKDALSLADVVIYDRLVHPRLLLHAPPEAERTYVGKQADRHSLTQDKINALLAENALAGKTVVRLKGGDPFVFGRGGEEAEHLRDLGIPFVILPGVTSAIAAPAYAGIPVTHRDASSSFAVITGHERADDRESGSRTPGDAEERRRWDKIANAADTLIFLMGVESLPDITARLIENGRSKQTPVALVRWGTWAGRQETVTGDLETIAHTVARLGFRAPAVTIVGDVVNWRPRLQWWDNRPLSGKRVVVTRAREQSSGLVELLIAEGAEPIEFPTIRTAEPADNFKELDAALHQLPLYDWIIFTSVNAVSAFGKRMMGRGMDARRMAGIKIAAVGPVTAGALQSIGIIADYLPASFAGDVVADEFPADPSGLKILIPGARQASEQLPDNLRLRGAIVDIATTYETVVDSAYSSELLERLAEGAVDVITFTSSSTVKNFVTALGAPPAAFAEVKIACIGPSTAKTAQESLRRDPDILAEVHTVPGLVAALKRYYEGETAHIGFGTSKN